MKCMRCGQEMDVGTTTEAVELGKGVLVIRNIPCHKCSRCGEVMYAGDVVQSIETITEDARQRMQEVAVVAYPQSA